MDCKKIEDLQQNYNRVMCGYSLLYLSEKEVEKLVSDIYNLLEPHGVLYLRTMEGDQDKSGWIESSFLRRNQDIHLVSIEKHF